MPTKLKLERRGDADWLIIEGGIDQDLGPKLKDMPLPSAAQLDIDLYGVDSCNSLGIRDWCLLLQRLSGSCKVRLHRCSPVFIMSLNVVPGMAARVDIVSVFRGFSCPSNHYWWEGYEIADVVMPQIDKALKRCPKCALMATPEVAKEEFFEFLFVE